MQSSCVSFLRETNRKPAVEGISLLEDKPFGCLYGMDPCMEPGSLTAGPRPMGVGSILGEWRIAFSWGSETLSDMLDPSPGLFWWGDLKLCFPFAF